MRRAYGAIVERVRHVFGADEPAARVAAAWALGVGTGLSPFLGFHTAIALGFAFAFRLNKIDVLLGTMISNPWFLSAYFPACVLAGQWMLGIDVPRIEIPELAQLFSLAAWREQQSWLRPLVLTWTAGATVAALVGGAVTYFLVKAAVIRHRRRRAAVHGEQRSG